MVLDKHPQVVEYAMEAVKRRIKAGKENNSRNGWSRLCLGVRPNVFRSHNFSQ
jgi:hypothetical protein